MILAESTEARRYSRIPFALHEMLPPTFIFRELEGHMIKPHLTVDAP